jgi:hypothetical protein
MSKRAIENGNVLAAEMTARDLRSVTLEEEAGGGLSSPVA